MKIRVSSNTTVPVFPFMGRSVTVGDNLYGMTTYAPDLAWLQRDEFLSTLAAGAVNGTYAEPGKGKRAVTDTASHLTLANGKLTIDGGVSAGNPRLGLTTPTFSRRPGIYLFTKINVTSSAVSQFYPLGIYNAIAPDPTVSARGFYRWTTAGLITVSEEGTTITVGDYANATNYYIAICLRAIGADYYIKGGAFTNWTLLYRMKINSSTSLWAAICGHDRFVFTADYLRPVQTDTMAVPLISDGFGGTWPTTDGAGHAETAGLGYGGSGMTWTARLGTWGSAGGVASCSALDGGAGIGITTATLNNADIWFECVPARSAGVVGIIVRYADAANYTYAINDGTNVKLFEVATGDPYPGTQRGTGAKAYSAGKRLIVDVSGAKSRVYYNEALIFTYDTLVNTTAKTIGLITNNTGNTFNDAAAYAKGTGGEYSILDRWSRD